MFSPLRNTLIAAFLLFVLDAFLLNQFLIAMLTILIGLPVFLVKLFRRRKDPVRRRLLLARSAVYLGMLFLIVGAFVFNNKLAERRAQRIIAACEQYRSRTHAYPDKLPQLVPGYLDEIPRAKPVLSGSSFFYVARPDEHALCYTTVPPFGRNCYLLEQKRWQMLD